MIIYLKNFSTQINKYKYLIILVLYLLCSLLIVGREVFIINTPYYLLSALILMLSLALMQRACAILSIKYVTIQSFAFGGFLFMIYIPTSLNFMPSQEIGLYYNNPVTIFQYTVLFSLLSYSAGVYLTNCACNFRVNEQNIYFNQLINKSDYKYDYKITATLTLVALIICMSYFVHIGISPLDYPLFKMFKTNDSMELAQAREAVFKLIDPRWSNSEYSFLFYIYLGLRMWLFPFLVLYTFINFLQTKETKWLLLFSSNMFLAVVYAAVSIARAPVAALLLRLSLIWYFYKNCKISRAAMTIAFLLVLLFPILVTSLAYTNSNIATAFYAVFRRLFITPSEDLYVYFQAFPLYFDFQYGSTILKPIYHLLGIEHFYIENEIYHFQFPYSEIPTGHANAAFISNLYADFGSFGGILGTFFIGVAIQYINIQLFRRKKNPMNLSVYVYLMYSFWIINFGSITSVIGTNGVFFIIAMPIVYRSMDYFFQFIGSRYCK